MSIFRELKQQLLAQLSAVRPNQGLVKLEADVDTQEASSLLLSWLKAQPHYPQTFWQDRDVDYAYATLGELYHFTDLAEAEAFSRKQNLMLIGGMSFEGDCAFRLPRLLFYWCKDSLLARLWLDSDRLAEERAVCVQILSHFEQTAPLSDKFDKPLQRRTRCDFTQWQHSVQHALTKIEQGELRKVVLANAAKLDFAEPLCAHSLLAKSLEQNRGCYHFLWADTPQSIFLGSSPEQLYSRFAQTISTEALAGTVAVENDAAQTEQKRLWLLNNPKNINENQLVVDDIRAQLTPRIAEFEVGELEVKQLKNVQHLRRRIQATLKDTLSDSHCLAQIHPTAAVLGLPRAQAKQFLTEHEPFQRGWYAGALGLLEPASATFCVALRSALVEANTLTVYAGAGIVEGSTAEEEWLEIQRKSAAILSLLD